MKNIELDGFDIDWPKIQNLYSFLESNKEARFVFEAVQVTNDVETFQVNELASRKYAKVLAENSCYALVEYWHYACKSGLIGFVDDIEVIYHQDSNELGFRSASRVGYSDLGANRKRIQKLIEFILF